MNKYVLFLMALIFGAAFALEVEAQVEITYEKLPSQNSDSEFHPGSFADGKISEKIAVSVVDADTVPSENVLRYAWIDVQFIIDSNKQLSEKQANINNRDAELVRLRDTGEMEDAKWYKEIQAVRMEGAELLINAWNYCITSAVELGYIPLNVSYKENAIGDKFRNAPDITWQVGNLMRKNSLKPYTSDKIGKSDLKIAYVMYDMLAKMWNLNSYDLYKQVILAGYSDSDIVNLGARVNSDFADFQEQVYSHQLEMHKQVMDAIKLKSQSWGYDGIVFADAFFFPPVILEAMDDVTYLAKQQCAPQELIQSFNEKVQKLCQEYRRRY